MRRNYLDYKRRGGDDSLTGGYFVGGVFRPRRGRRRRLGCFAPDAAKGKSGPGGDCLRPCGAYKALQQQRRGDGRRPNDRASKPSTARPRRTLRKSGLSWLLTRLPSGARTARRSMAARCSPSPSPTSRESPYEVASVACRPCRRPVSGARPWPGLSDRTTRGPGSPKARRRGGLGPGSDPNDHADVADYQIGRLAARPDNDWVLRGPLHRRDGDVCDDEGRKVPQGGVALGQGRGRLDPAARDRRHADALCCGQTYLELYFLKPPPRDAPPDPGGHRPDDEVAEAGPRRVVVVRFALHGPARVRAPRRGHGRARNTSTL